MSSENYPPPPPPPHSAFGHPAFQQTRTSGLAITSLVLSLVSFLCCTGIGHLAGLIFGHCALSQIKGSQGTISGRGIALAGVILGYLGVAFLAMMMVVMFAGIGSSGGGVMDFAQKTQEVQLRGPTIVKAIDAWQASHGGKLPPDLNTLVADGLLIERDLRGPGPDADPAFYELRHAGEDWASLADTEVVLATKPLRWKQFWIDMRQDFTVTKAGAVSGNANMNGMGAMGHGGVTLPPTAAPPAPPTPPAAPAAPVPAPAQ